MLKYGKKMDLSDLYANDEYKFVKCRNCIYYNSMDFFRIESCTKRMLYLEKDMAINCPLFTCGSKKNDKD